MERGSRMIRDKINSVLKSVNGKRRTRLLDESDIIRLIGESLQNGQSTTGGGTVANAYFKKYFGPAYQTVACSLKKNNSVYVSIGVKSASKGTSQIPTKVGLSAFGLKNWDGKNADITLNIGQARRLVNNWRKERGELLSLPKALQDILVTKEDSISVGNCSAYTDKIATEMGNLQLAKANDIFSFVKRKYPDQLSRAVRAIRWAANRLKPVGVETGV